MVEASIQRNLNRGNHLLTEIQLPMSLMTDIFCNKIITFSLKFVKI